jgi:superfamily II DNA or RNA helicase
VPCNLTQGARDAADRRVQPRRWQLDALPLAMDAIVRTGAATVSAAPGAGKTVFASLVFEALREAGFVDRMVACVPRHALVGQWADKLAVQRHLQLKPHSAIERHGQDGVVVTYQSLDNPDTLDAHQTQARHVRTLLVLDEVHHVGKRKDGKLPAWAKNVATLAGDVEAHDLHVAGVLNLSGTLWRSAPGERISTVHYKTLDDNRLQSRVDAEVTVAELVGRGELRPLDLYRLGAQVRLADYQNLEHVEGDLSDLDEQPARAAMAALASIGEWRTAFVAAVLDRLEVAHRALEGHYVKALIVAPRQDDAAAFRDEVNKQMRERGLRPVAELATTDTPDSADTLVSFAAQKRVGVLCTVDMAGEGYDCPEIAVIGYASNKLTSLYVRQVTARAMRVTDQERKLERVIPAAVVLPDAQQLVEQLVSYLAPFTHEVLIPDDAVGGALASTEDERKGGGGMLPFSRYILEDARARDEGTVTVPHADGSREDVDAALARHLAEELEKVNVAGIFAPRIIAAARRTVGDLLASRPFAQPGADAIALEKLATGAEAVAEAEAEVSRSSTIEGQAAMLMNQIDHWARWWQKNGDSPVGVFNQMVNQAGGIAKGKRPSASVGQLRRSWETAKAHIGDYCARTGVKPPRGMGAR